MRKIVKKNQKLSKRKKEKKKKVVKYLKEKD